MKLIVEVSPHKKADYDICWLMKQVLIGLTPVVLASIIFFRMRAVLLIISCLLGAVISEEVWMRLRKKPSSLRDYSAVITGILLALVLPRKRPLWVGFLGGVVSIILGKQVFGGLGQNIFNPALV
ncbi:MAG: hypothetical protein DRP61_04100, partial [Candidatus Omnitrophota bacterium]